MMERFPILKRKTPVIDLLRGSPEFRERPLLGFLAETPEEIRSLRRGVVGGLGAGLALALVMAPVLERAREAG